MKNPLNKRLLRELRTEFGKYAVIFLFMVMTIGLESGDLVASDSMIATCNQRYEKYHVENGHFHLKQKMKDEAVNKIEKEDKGKNILIDILVGLFVTIVGCIILYFITK